MTYIVIEKNFSEKVGQLRKNGIRIADLLGLCRKLRKEERSDITVDKRGRKMTKIVLYTLGLLNQFFFQFSCSHGHAGNHRESLNDVL